MTGLWCQVFKKADRGAWDEGAELRDERVLAKRMAKRMTGRKVWFVWRAFIPRHPTTKTCRSVAQAHQHRG
jgi:hypothetical protein